MSKEDYLKARRTRAPEERAEDVVRRRISIEQVALGITTRAERDVVTHDILEAEHDLLVCTAAFARLTPAVYASSARLLQNDKQLHIESFGDDSLYQVVPYSDCMPNPLVVRIAVKDLVAAFQGQLNQVSQLAGIPQDLFAAAFGDPTPFVVTSPINYPTKKNLIWGMKRLADAEVVAPSPRSA